MFLALSIGLALTAAGVCFLERMEEQQLRLEFENAAESRVAAIQKTVDTQRFVLAAIRSLFLGSERVERREFREFVEPALEHMRSIRALEWLPRVLHQDRSAFEAGVREEGFEGFRILGRNASGALAPAPEREEHYPVYFVEPFELNRTVLGYDPASEPGRSEALFEARDTGAPAASAAMPLIQGGDGEMGFVLYLPVYGSAAPPETEAHRRRDLRGFVAGVFHAERIVESSMEYISPRGVDIELLDRSAPEGNQLLCRWSSRLPGDPESLLSRVERCFFGRIGYTKDLEVGGRTWEIRCAPTAAFIRDHRRWYPFVIVPVGFLITGLVVAYILAVTGRTRKIERLVNERTAELVRANEELRETQLKLIQAAKLESVGRLAAGVAHEVKNPLAIIQLGLDYLGRTAGGRRELLETVKDMDDAVQRADQVVKGLVDFSRSEKLDLAAGDLNAVVEAALNLVKHELVKNKISLHKELADGLPALPLDRHKLEQVFINLCMNAIQAMGREGTLTVRTAAVRNAAAGTVPARGDGGEGRGPAVEARVEDTGPGIPEEKLDKIFDPFFTTKPAGQGTGLGLSVTRNIVELHGATLRARNRDGGGASFVITFPLEGAKA